MKDEIFRYPSMVSIPFPNDKEDFIFVQQRLNMIYCGELQPALDTPIPQVCKDAHWSWCAGRVQEVTIAVYADGSRAIVSCTKEEQNG